MTQNDIIYERFTSLRRNYPKSYALSMIGIAWDMVNNEFKANGRSDLFFARMKYLKKRMSDFSSVVSSKDIEEWAQNYPSYVNEDNLKYVHGYDWNYDLQRISKIVEEFRLRKERESKNRRFRKRA